MKPLVLATAALLSIPAAAGAAVTIQGHASSASLRDHDPGLVVKWSPIAFGPFTLDLDPVTANPSFFTTNVLRIGTDETAVNLFAPFPVLEDVVHYPISVNFSFANPFDATGGPVTGETFGVFLLDVGVVDWDGPTVFSFGTGGSFSLELFDAVFGTPGHVDVTGKFRLLSESRVPPPVPEPATWAMMLLGFGAVGCALRRSRQRPAMLQIA